MQRDGFARLLLLHVAALSTAGAVAAAAAVLRRRHRRRMKEPLPAPAMAEMPQMVVAEHGHVRHIEKFSHYVARQMGFEDVNECPQLCKVASSYLNKTKNCMDDIYDLLANAPEAESLYVKLVEELDKCILGYFAFHWDLCTTLISQALAVDTATKKKFRNLVLEATRKQRFERVTRDLKVTRVFSTLVEEMKAIGIVTGTNGSDDEAHCTDIMAPVAHADRSPVLLLMGGGMGAGKSTVLKEILEEPFWTEAGANAVVVEADAFKETDLIYRAISSMGHHNDMLHTAELLGADAGVVHKITAFLPHGHPEYKLYKKYLTETRVCHDMNTYERCGHLLRPRGVRNNQDHVWPPLAAPLGHRQNGKHPHGQHRRQSWTAAGFGSRPPPDLVTHMMPPW